MIVWGILAVLVMIYAAVQGFIVGAERNAPSGVLAFVVVMLGGAVLVAGLFATWWLWTGALA